MTEQKITKPKFEETVSNLFDGDMKKSALDFLAQLRENKISISRSNSDNWKISCKGMNLGKIMWLGHNSWTIETYGDDSKEFEKFIENENLQEIMQNNYFKCRLCNPKLCSLQAKKPENNFYGFTKTYFGKELNNTCKHWLGGVFRNPNEQTLDCIKKILIYKKQMERGGILSAKPYTV